MKEEADTHIPKGDRDTPTHHVRLGEVDGECSVHNLRARLEQDLINRTKKVIAKNSQGADQDGAWTRLCAANKKMRDLVRSDWGAEASPETQLTMKRLFGSVGLLGEFVNGPGVKLSGMNDPDYQAVTPLSVKTVREMLAGLESKSQYALFYERYVKTTPQPTNNTSPAKLVSSKSETLPQPETVQQAWGRIADEIGVWLKQNKVILGTEKHTQIAAALSEYKASLKEVRNYFEAANQLVLLLNALPSPRVALVGGANQLVPRR
jgi:hypothetical protein